MMSVALKMSVNRCNFIEMEELVISGISGRFPEADNMTEFKENLMNHVDMVTSNDRRWPAGIHGLPPRMGTLRDLSRFDSGFFEVHDKQAEVMDPQYRLILETAYEAIVDAGLLSEGFLKKCRGFNETYFVGLHPNDLSGTKTGVFAGVAKAESREYWNGSPERVNGYGLPGNATSMSVNRVSYAFDLKGPSITVDTACASSAVAFHEAIQSIRCGESEAALVSGVNVILQPLHSLQFIHLKILHPEGVCRTFDARSGGYVKSEACVTVLVQKKSAAKRAYATVAASGTNCDGYKEEGVTHPSETMQRALAEGLYQGIGLDARKVQFVEAHGTGTTVGDRVEGNWMADFFCQNRHGPLLVGSVKSNVGHPEPAAGVVSLAKIIIAMETGVIPANLHYLVPNPDIPGLHDGRLQVVDKNWNWEGGYVAMNNFGLGGTNVHVVLKSNETQKRKSDEKPCLICVSGRTQTAVDKMLTKIENTPFDDDFITLIHNIFRKPIKNLNYSGFTVLGSKRPIRSSTRTMKGKEVWFVFPGVGTQWKGMGQGLMTLEPFRKSIGICSAELDKLGFNLESVLTSANDDTFDDVTNCFTSICAIQIALVDTLESLKILPDYFIGHSMGEIACAYADGLLSREQAMLVSYWRGRCLSRLTGHEGGMAAIGLSLEEAETLCAGTNVTVACHNGVDSVTITGPADEVNSLMNDISSTGKFVKSVPSAGMAMHSKYLAPCLPELKAALKKILPNPKKRSSRWLSTSFPVSQWEAREATHFSAEYLISNLMNPVRFYDAVKKIPREGAIVVEVSPHATLLALLRRSAPEATIHVGLLKKDMDDELSFFMGNIGKLYTAGLNPDLTVFHPPSQFPVARGTPMISPLIEWDHSREWAVPSFIEEAGGNEIVCEINAGDDDAYKYLLDHKIDGRVLFPASGYLEIAWKVFSKINQSTQDQSPVVFENVHFLRNTVIPNKGSLKFRVKILEATGCFEIFDGETLVTTGVVRRGGETKGTLQFNEHSGTNTLTQEDVYTILRLRGYEYEGGFKLIQRLNGIHGVLDVTAGNWTTLIDAVLQVATVRMATDDLYLPTRIGKCSIDPKRLSLENCPVRVNFGGIDAGPVEIRNVEYALTQRRPNLCRQVQETACFVPYICSKEMDEYDVLTIFLQIVKENLKSVCIKVLEIDGNAQIISILTEISHFDPSFNLQVDTTLDNSDKYDLLCSVRLSDMMGKIVSKIKSDGFILTEEFPIVNGISEKFTVIAQIPCKGRVYNLLKAQLGTPMNPNNVVTLSSIIQTSTVVADFYRVDESQPTDSLLDLLTTQINGSCLVIADKIELNDHRKQLMKGLKVNIFKNGVWGSLRQLKCRPVNPETTCAYAGTLTRGDLTSLRWIQDSRWLATKHHYTVYYSAVNLLDLMLASGRTDLIPGFKPDKEYNLGLEFTGKDVRGRRVMGLVNGKALATTVSANPSLVWTVPEVWTLEEAATVPFNYVVSCYALLIKAKLTKTDCLLIHGGWKGFGQAAIHVGLGLGSRVLTTVDSNAQRSFLHQTFPELPDSDILSTKNFDQIILNESTGVDIVLNLLEGAELCESSVRCLKEHGRMVEVGKFELAKCGSLGEQIFLKNISFHVFSLESLIEDNVEVDNDKNLIHELINDGIRLGFVKPLPFTTFDWDQLEQAFRHSGSGKDFRKVLIKLKDHSTSHDFRPASVTSVARFYLNPNKSCVIVGGLGIFSLELARWLISRGTRRVIIASKQGVRRGYQSFLLKRLQVGGSQGRGDVVVVSLKRARSMDETSALLKEARTSLPVGSIFNITGIKSSNGFDKITRTAANLDAASRILCPDLEHFIYFTTCHTESNRSNFILEKICQERATERLPGTVIKFGSILNEIQVLGTRPQSVTSCLSALDLISNATESAPVIISKLVASQMDETAAVTASDQSSLVNAVGKILGIKEIKCVEDSSSLEDLGMDSLMGAEIFQLVENKHGLVLNKKELRSLTFQRLREIDSKGL